MATSEIWLPPKGPPSLTLINNKPQTSSKRDWYEKTFSDARMLSQAVYTNDYLGQQEGWAGGTPWIWYGYYNGKWTDRVITGLDTKTEAYGILSIGPGQSMSNSNNTCNYPSDVIGVSFVYDRQDCWWEEADIRIAKVGVRYWNINTQTETVEICRLMDSGGDHPPDVNTKPGNRDAPPALAVYQVYSSSAQSYYRDRRTICIGFYIQCHIKADGNYGVAKHWHRLGICELAPIHDTYPSYSTAMASMENWAPSDKMIRVA